MTTVQNQQQSGTPVSLAIDHSKYISPAVGKDIELRIREWEKAKGKPVFVRVFRQSEDGSDCKNCAGAGRIYVSYCAKGPWDAPSIVFSGRGANKKAMPMTWFDGNGIYYKGWYVIEETVPYDCPRCNGRGKTNA